MTMMMRRPSQPSSRVLNELTLLLYNLLQSPPSPIELFSGDPCYATVPSSPRLRRRGVVAAAAPITPSGFASLLLGISIALMLCGSLTFLIGIMLMPWVLGLVMLFYLVGFVSSLSVLGRSIICYATAASSHRAPLRSTRKDIHSW